jgi:putative ABC transport system permease protein
VRSVWAAGLLLRRWRAEGGVLVVLWVLVAATALVFAAAPRLFDRVADDGLGYALRSATPAQRDLTLADTDSIPPGPDGGVATLRAYGDRQEQAFPAAVEDQVTGRSLRFTTVRLLVANPPIAPTHLALRYQDGVTAATRLVAGRWPVDRGLPLRPASPDESSPPAIVEVAFSKAEADQIGVSVGDHFAVSVDGSDPLVSARRIEIAPAVVVVVGLFEPIDPASDTWAGDSSLLEASVSGSEENPVYFATAFVAAQAYRSLWSSSLPFRYEWHFQVGARLDADHVAGLRDGLRRLAASAGSTAGAAPGSLQVQTGLPALLDRYVAQRSLTEAILSFAAIGPLALAGAAVGLVGVLLVTRRRASLALARGRGASWRLVLGAQLWEATLLAGSAALAGFVAAEVAIPARDDPLSTWLTLAVGAVAVAVLVATSWPAARRPLGQLERDDPPILRVPPRRLVIELTIVGAAVAGAYLLRQRGLTASTSGDVARFDPFLAAVPVLGGLAAGILAVRLAPLPIRGLGWLAAQRRDLVPVLGLRTIGRLPGASNLPLLVLMLTAAFGAFSSVLASSIERGQVVASAREVGADYRIEVSGLGSLPSLLDPRTVAGVEAAAPAFVDARAPLLTFASQNASVYLDAVDAPGYAVVAEGSGADPSWPRAFLAAPLGADPGSDANPVPAILSSELPAGSSSLAVGGTFHATIAARTSVARTLAFRVVERRATFPGLGGSRSFLVAPLGWIQAAYGAGFLPITAIWVRAPADAATALTTTIAASGTPARLVSRYEILAKLRDAPLVAAVPTGYGIALGVAAIYLALAFIGAMVLSARRRTQDLAYLRTLGVSARQSLALTAVEQAPAVVLALVPGVALGVYLAVVLEPGLGLATFQGAGGIPLFVDWAGLGLIVAGLIGVVAGGVAIGTWLARRPGWTDALRIGDA